MNITLKLYASLGDFLPPEAHRNAIKLELDDGASIRDALDRFNVPIDICHLILLNGIYSPPATSHQADLKEGDVVAAWPPIAGG